MALQLSGKSKLKRTPKLAGLILAAFAVAIQPLLSLNISSVFAATENIKKIAFTSSEQTIGVNKVSAKMTVTLQNSDGTEEKTDTSSETLKAISTLSGGEFSRNGEIGWTSSLTFTVSKGTANVNFYYRSSQAGSGQIEVFSMLGHSDWESAQQKITVKDSENYRTDTPEVAVLSATAATCDDKTNKVSYSGDRNLDGNYRLVATYDNDKKLILPEYLPKNGQFSAEDAVAQYNAAAGGNLSLPYGTPISVQAYWFDQAREFNPNRYDAEVGYDRYIKLGNSYEMNLVNPTDLDCNTDTTPPTINFVNFEKYYNPSSSKIHLTATDDSGITNWKMEFHNTDGKDLRIGRVPCVQSTPGVSTAVNCYADPDYANPLKDGETYIVHATVSDKAGNKGVAEREIVIDRTGPSIKFTDNKIIYNPKTAKFEGEATDQAGVGGMHLWFYDVNTGKRIGVDSVPCIYKGGKPTTKTVSCSVAKGFEKLKEGQQYIARLSATDGVGNENTVDKTITIDTTAPEISDVLPATGVTTKLANGKLEVSAKVTDASEISKVTMYLRNKDDAILDGSRNGTNQFLLQVKASLVGDRYVATFDAKTMVDGNYSLRVIADDAADNKAIYNNNYTEHNFVIDNSGPIVKKNLPSDDAFVQDKLTLEFDAQDVSGVRQVNIHLMDGNDTKKIVELTHIEGNIWSVVDLDVSDLADGTYGIVSRAVDNLGTLRAGTGTNHGKITIDNTVPTLRLINPGELTSGTIVKPTDDTKFIASDKNLQKVAIYKDGDFSKPYKVYDFSKEKGYADIKWLPEGKYTLRAYDKAGNVSDDFVITIDSTAPTITIKEDSVANEEVYSKISFKLFDVGKVDKFAINGKEFNLTDNKWSDANFDAIKNFLVDGENTLKVYDVAGNEATRVFTYVVAQAANEDSTPDQNTDDKDSISTPNSNVGNSNVTPSVESSSTTVSSGERVATIIANGVNLNTIFGGTNGLVQGGAAVLNNDASQATAEENEDSEDGVAVAIQSQDSNGTSLSDEGGEVLGATTEVQGCGKFFGICWYWWVPIVVAVVGVIWFVVYRTKQRNDATA